MLGQLLRDAIDELAKLIEITKADVQALLDADHDQIFQRLPLKEALIKRFEEKKSLIDSQMLALKNQNPTKEISSFLSDEVLDLLGDLKTALLELKEINNGYAKNVYAVGEFYTSLLRRIVPHENSGYGGYAKPQQNFLVVQV